MKKRADVLQSYKLTSPSVQNPTEILASEVAHDEGYLLSKNMSINYTSKLAPSQERKERTTPEKQGNEGVQVVTVHHKQQ